MEVEPDVHRPGRARVGHDERRQEVEALGLLVAARAGFQLAHLGAGGNLDAPDSLDPDLLLGLRVEKVDPADGVPLRAGGFSPRLEVERPESPFDEAVEPDHVFSPGSRLQR